MSRGTKKKSANWEDIKLCKLVLWTGFIECFILIKVSQLEKIFAARETFIRSEFAASLIEN